MTERTHTTPASNEHGSTSSYVIGFVLSLILTVIPYVLVTRQILTGSTLLLTILGFAILQMIVQVFFFLHLGRGPKPLYNTVFFVATVSFIILIVGASILIMNNLYRNMSPAEVTTRLAQDENIAEINGRSTGACQGNKANHVVMLSAVEVAPFHVTAKRCDTITFKSGDQKPYELMFGSHHEPTSYGGLFEIEVRADRAEIVTLNETGNFSYHDSTDHGVTGSFTVEP